MVSIQRFYFLDLLRVFAAWLVVYDHLIAIYGRDHNYDFYPVQLVTNFIVKPLGIIQDFGWFGVCLFFLISGFIITHVSLRENAFEFAIKRIFRIFPLYFIAILISILLFPDILVLVNSGTLITNLFLINYWIAPQIVLLGVGWTLAIEVLFYCIVLLCFTFKHKPVLLVSVELSLVALVIYFCRNFGDNFFLFSASMSYVPYLIVGQILYLSLHRKNLPPLWAVFYLFLCYLVLLSGLINIHPVFLGLENSYLLNFLYAVLVFVLCYQFNSQLKHNKILELFANTSYIVYLIHGTLGYFLLSQLDNIVGYFYALIISISIVILVSWYGHLMVEKPIMSVARRIILRVGSRS